MVLQHITSWCKWIVRGNTDRSVHSYKTIVNTPAKNRRSSTSKSGYTALDVANWFIAGIDRTVGDSITHLKLQKLVYYAQAWALVLIDKPLFDEDFEAWAHGPVARVVYDAFKHHGFNPINDPSDAVPEFDEEALTVLNEVQRVYGERSAKRLEDLTHNERPWLDARGGLPDEAKCETIISKESMKEFYSDLLRRLTDG